MPLRAARRGRVGVIGHPVAKTAVVARAVSPGPSPVAKTAVVAAAVTPGRVSAGGGASDRGGSVDDQFGSWGLLCEAPGEREMDGHDQLARPRPAPS